MLRCNLKPWQKRAGRVAGAVGRGGVLGRVLRGALAFAAGRADVPEPWACSQVCTAGASAGGLGRQVGEEDMQGLGEVSP